MVKRTQVMTRKQILMSASRRSVRKNTQTRQRPMLRHSSCPMIRSVSHEMYTVLSEKECEGRPASWMPREVSVCVTAKLLSFALYYLHYPLHLIFGGDVLSGTVKVVVREGAQLCCQDLWCRHVTLQLAGKLEVDHVLSALLAMEVVWRAGMLKRAFTKLFWSAAKIRSTTQQNILRN